MFNLKNKTLMVAMFLALGLSACGDNADVSQKAEVREEMSAAAKIEQEVDKEIRENSFKPFYDFLKIQQYVIETFPKYNIRMEPTLENYKWYAKRKLVPPFKVSKTAKKYDLNDPKSKEELLRATDKFLNDLTETFVNNKGEPNQKTLAIVKDLFLSSDGSFNEKSLFFADGIDKLAAFILSFDFLYFDNIDKNGKLTKDPYKDILDDGFITIIRNATILFIKEFLVSKRTKNENFIKDWQAMGRQNK